MGSLENSDQKMVRKGLVYSGSTRPSRRQGHESGEEPSTKHVEGKA